MTIIGPQFRAARAMLGWTVRELARRSIVSIATIHAIEDTNVPAIQAALEEGGIEFTNGDEPIGHDQRKQGQSLRDGRLLHAVGRCAGTVAQNEGRAEQGEALTGR
jgi:transcriptional regulator with XRE-family HTH domain